MSAVDSVIGFIIVFAAGLILTPVNIWFSRKTGLVDHPHPRGIHKSSVPLAGGLSFAIPILLVQGVWMLLDPESTRGIGVYTVGGVAVTALGLVDDKYRLSAWWKLLFQILIILGICSLGLRINVLTNPLNGEFHLGWTSYPVTIFWFLLVMNAFNLTDGMDGLAAGISVIAGAVLFVAGYQFHNGQVMFLSALLAAGCLAFLRYNFYPARIFMGDTGSLFIGYSIAGIAIAGSGQLKGITAMTIVVPLITLFIPLFDTFHAIGRRIRDKRHIFHGDKGHLHHRLLSYGFSQRSIALIVWFVTLMFGLIAVGFTYATKDVLLVILLLLIVVLTAVLWLLLNMFQKLAQKIAGDETKED